MTKKRTVFLVGHNGVEHNEVVSVHAKREGEHGADKGMERMIADMIADQENHLRIRLSDTRTFRQEDIQRPRDAIAALKANDIERMYEVMWEWPYIEERDLEE